jgi:adsorption protein B
VISYFHLWTGVDSAVLWVLKPLTVAILLSGLDDLFVNAVWAWVWIRSLLQPSAKMFPPGRRQLESAPRRKIAILVPLWHEHAVIADMLQHNIASIRYPDYHVFAGCYPNDDQTQEAVRSVAARFPNVHMALCPHNGPTSKGDCLNWVYQHILLHEEEHATRFDLILTHDAEDMIHPDELRWINFYSGRFDFIQTPVLPLATPLRRMIHGIYCDEFAENHTIDMAVRARTGGFVPGAGVGTGYRREALDRLAQAASNKIFEPDSLTEDYENGLRLFRLGCTQVFVPISSSGEAPLDWVATRELFPQNWNSALRQRTRWVTGISLQGWSRFGWRGKPGELYWLWRDRKGLLGNSLSVLANLIFLYGLATGLWRRIPPPMARLATATFTLLVVRTLVRMACTGRVYGWRFALGVPLRTVYANLLNSAASIQASVRYLTARLKREPLAWMKTEHAYPSRAALLSHKRKLGEILVSSGCVTDRVLREAISTCPAGVRLGEHLVSSGRLSMTDLYEALSLQQGLPLASVEPNRIPSRVAQALPKQVVRELKVVPFQVAEGALYLAGPELPSAQMSSMLRSFTSLELRFHLVTPQEFERLANALL